MPESKPVSFGIVGCGTASVPVCEAIATLPRTKLTVVYDVNEAMANDIARRFQVRAAKTLDDLLSDPLVDAVYIAVPHYQLAPLARTVLQAGKPALVEKPLAISLMEIDQLEDLANQKQLALGVFYEMRYAPAHTVARDLIRAGAIGKIVGVQIQTLIDKPLGYWQSGYAGRSNNPWRGIKAQAGGGVTLMNSSHQLEALFYITGLQVTHVSAEIGNLVSNVEVEDLASATLRFDNSAIGSLLAGAHIIGARHEECCCIYGTHGTLRLPDPYGSDALQIYLRRPWDHLAAEQWHTIPAQPVSVYQRAIEDFAQAVKLKSYAPVDAQAARRVLTVILAIYQSAAEGRTIPIL